MRYRVRLFHLHKHNSTDVQRKKSVYMTVANLLDDADNIVHTTTARCRQTDAPSRKMGRQIAMNRMRKFVDNYNLGTGAVVVF